MRPKPHFYTTCSFYRIISTHGARMMITKNDRLVTSKLKLSAIFSLFFFTRFCCVCLVFFFHEIVETILRAPGISWWRVIFADIPPPPPLPFFFFLRGESAKRRCRDSIDPAESNWRDLDLERLVVIQPEFLSNGFVERLLVSVSISEDNGGRRERDARRDVGWDITTPR